MVGPVTQSSGGWFDQSFRVSDYVNSTDQFKIRFTACDTGEGSVCEAAIDGFVVRATGCDDAACPADATGDGTVDLADLNLVLANFGQSTSDGDTNDDGNVDLADLNAVLAEFGSACP